LQNIYASAIQSGLGFLEGLRTSENLNKFWETMDQTIDHEVYTQSQYLMYTLYTVLGSIDKADAVKANNDFFAPAGDRPGIALDRFCVIVKDTQNFAANRLRTQAAQYAEDCVALMGLYCKLREHEKLWPVTRRLRHFPSSDDCFAQLVSYYDPNLGFFPNKSGLSEMYKISLFSVLASRVRDQQWTDQLVRRLTDTQSKNGGWKTHWISRNTPNPTGTTENLETTALSILALHLSQSPSNSNDPKTSENL
jgi:hypothetical protein